MKDDTTTEGCIRCRDYEKIKDELESNKRRSQDEQKNALKKCEDGKAKLQKKLLTVGAVAIVAGTILGKDFVDKVAEYIESFNSVKDAATKMVSQATPTPTPTPDPITEPEPEESDEEEEKQERSTDSALVWLGDDTMRDVWSPPSYGGMSLIDIVTMDNLQSPLQKIFNEEYDSVSPLSDIDFLTSFGSFQMPMELDLSYAFEDISSIPSSPFVGTPAAIVPEAHSFLPLAAIPIVLNRRGRKS